MAVVQEIKVPLISVNDTKLTVIDICFLAGDQVKKGDVILVFETSKTTYEVGAEVNGYIQYMCATDEDYEVDTIVAMLYDNASEVQVYDNLPLEKNTQMKLAAHWTGETLFSKGALHIINERGLNRKLFAGSDFISKEDVLVYLGESKKNQSAISPDAEIAKENRTSSISETQGLVQKLSANKKLEVEYLGSVQAVGLTSTVNNFIDTDGIFIHLNESLKALKNSLLPVTIYEASRLLAKYKKLNAFYAEGSICYYEKINIGFAIDLDQGLKVLKVPDAQKKTISEIEEDIIGLSGKYLDNALHYDDLTDITFTITDLSSEKVAFFRPLVNYRNSAILGISSIDEKLDRCTFTVTFDHRVTEGKLVAKFLNDLKSRLESYRSNHFASHQHIKCFKCYKLLAEDLSDVGFTKCITPNGENAFICQSCLKGF
ncbi:MAG: 2-oxo acid dehydrogenase subunit E2 [Ginsengibacter sp.]